MEKMFTWSKNGMKMLIDSGYKTFDKQTNCLTTGNAITNTQYSNYIRPYTEKESYGKINKEGYLRDYDLKYFETNLMTNDFKNWLEHFTRNNKAILYEYCIYRNGKKDIIGWLVENASTKTVVGMQYNIYSSVRAYNCTKVLEFCKKFIEYKRGV